MTDDGTQKTNATATGDGGNGAGGSAGDERDKWTRAEWERHAQKESDRRVTDALKEREEEFKTLLASTSATAEEKLKHYETQLAQERTRAEFMAEATAKGVADPKAAFLVATSAGFVSDKGVIDFDRLKKDHPVLFGSAVATSAAGARPDTGGSGKLNMTAMIRQAAKG